MDDTLKKFLQSPVVIKALLSCTTLSDFLDFCNSQGYNITNHEVRTILKIPSEVCDTDNIVHIMLALHEIYEEHACTPNEGEELQKVSGGINYFNAVQTVFSPTSFFVADSLAQTVSNTLNQVQAANYSEQLDQLKASQRQRINDYKKSIQ